MLTRGSHLISGDASMADKQAPNSGDNKLVTDTQNKDKQSNNKSAAILGASSALGQAIARQLAEKGHTLYLAARDDAKLDTVQKDLLARGASRVVTLVTDFDDIGQHDELVSGIASVDAVYTVYGTLPDQTLCENDWDATMAALQTNFISTASLLGRLANEFESRGQGTLIVVSSVAGDRGRKSNYVYGSAKGALSIFSAGLRNRLAGTGVHVLTVKPGFIDTPMTQHLEKKPAILWVNADKVATDILKAEAAGKNSIYTPWFWRYILLIISHIPEFIFKRLSL